MDLTGVLQDINGRSKPHQNATNVNGILCCRECGKPVEKRVFCERLGLDMVVRILCECEKVNRDREERAQDIQKEKEICFGKVGYSLYSKYTFANDNGKNDKMKLARNYAKHFDEVLKDDGEGLPMGKGLLIYGTVGTGKSYMAASIANEIIERGHTALFTNFVDIGNKLRTFDADIKKSVMRTLRMPSLLILDDLGVESANDYMRSVVFEVVQMRLEARKPIIVTTNITKQELLNCQDIDRTRIYDRLLQCCIPVEVIGKSMRRAGFAEDYYKAMDILQEG